MVDFLDAVVELGRRGLCNTIETRNDLAAAMSSLRVMAGGVSIAPANLITVGSESAANFLNCPASGGPYPALPPDNVPFTGGQCPGTQYSYDAVWTANGNQESSSQDFAALGPVVGLEVENLGATKNLVLVANGGLQRTVLRGIGSQFELTPVSLTLRPPTNGPDDCGDPPGTPAEVPLNYDLPDGTPTSENVTVTVGPPFINPDGTIYFPVRIQGNGLDVELRFPSTGGEPEVGVPGADPDATACCPMEGTDGDSPPSPEDPPNDSNRRITGVRVVVTGDAPEGRITRILDGGGPELDFPRMGSVSFGVNAGGQLTWLNPEDVKGRDILIPCPYDEGAVDVRGNPVAGVTFDLNPVYAEVSNSI